ncbi:MAG: VCBS repeat-containing protein [candidate division WOR-3 bacterium]
MFVDLWFLITAQITGDAASVDPARVSGQSDSRLSGRASLPSMPGWPKTFPTTGYAMCGHLLADINGDGMKEVLVGTGSGLYAYDYQGTQLWYYPTGSYRVMQRPSVGDLDGDGDIEIAFVGTTNSSGYLYVVDHLGANLPGWPKAVGDNPFSPVMWDLDGNGDLEIILGQRAFSSGRVDVWHHTGTAYGGWPKTLDYMCVATPSVGDLDQDGTYEIVAVSYYSLYIWDSNGNQELVLSNAWGGQSYAQPTLFDLDGDSDLEIGVTFYTGGMDSIAVFHHTGARAWARALGGPQAYTTPVASDVLEDGTGDVEVLDAMNHNATANWLHMFSNAGAEMPGWPVSVTNITESTPILFDFDDDRELEVLMPNNSTGLFAFNRNGTPVSGSPFDIQGPAFLAAIHVADVDRDGDPELSLLCDPNPMYANLWTLTGVKFRRYLAPYPMRLHDLWATGWIHPQKPTGISASQMGADVQLSWNPNPEPDLAGYFIYRRTGAGDWDTIGFTTGTSFTDLAPPPGAYWYGVTAYIKGDVESYMDTTGIALGAGEGANEPENYGILVKSRSITFKGQGIAEVYDATGRLTASFPVEREKVLTMEEPGVYLARFKTSARTLYKKAIIR